MTEIPRQTDIEGEKPASPTERGVPPSHMDLVRATIVALVLAAPSAASAQGFVMEVPLEFDGAAVLKPDVKGGLAFGGHMKTTPVIAAEPAWVHGFTLMVGPEISSSMGSLILMAGPGSHVVVGHGEDEEDGEVEGNDEIAVVEVLNAGEEEGEVEAVWGFEFSAIFHSRRFGFHGDIEFMFEDGNLHEVYARTILNFGKHGHGPVGLIWEISGVNEGEEDRFLSRFGVGIAPWKEEPFQIVATVGGGMFSEAQKSGGFATAAVGVRIDAHLVNQNYGKRGHDGHDHDDHDDHDHDDHDGHDH